MALDTVAANGLKTVYALSNRPFSSDLKKELEGKVNNLQKGNLPPSTVEPLSPELLEEIKNQGLLVVRTAEKSKKFSITTWVFLSLTIAAVALAILAPMIVLPIAGAFGIVTIVFSALYLKSSMEKNKELSNLAYLAFDNLPNLAKIQEQKDVAQKTSLQIPPKVKGKENKLNQSGNNNSNGTNNNSNGNNSNSTNNNSNANNTQTRPTEQAPPVNQQPPLIADGHIMEEALQHALRERCGFQNVSQFHQRGQICQNLLRYFNREPGAALNLNILSPLVHRVDDSLKLYNIIDNIFRGVRAYYNANNIWWNGHNWMQTMRNPSNWIELTDTMKSHLSTIVHAIHPENGIEELKYALVSASCWVIRSNLRTENPNLNEIQNELLIRLRQDLPNTTITPQLMQTSIMLIWARRVLTDAIAIRRANLGNFSGIYDRSGNVINPNN